MYSDVTFNEATKDIKKNKINILNIQKKQWKLDEEFWNRYWKIDKKLILKNSLYPGTLFKTLRYPNNFWFLNKSLKLLRNINQVLKN